MTSATPTLDSALPVLRGFKADLARRFGARLEQVRLFGSVARGDAHDESDVDVLVVVRDLTGPERSEIADLAADVFPRHGLYVSARAWSCATWDQHVAAEALIAQDILRDGIDV